MWLIECKIIIKNNNESRLTKYIIIIIRLISSKRHVWI